LRIYWFVGVLRIIVGRSCWLLLSVENLCDESVGGWEIDICDGTRIAGTFYKILPGLRDAANQHLKNAVNNSSLSAIHSITPFVMQFVLQK
jgi:hypothetical protein